MAQVLHPGYFPFCVPEGEGAPFTEYPAPGALAAVMEIFWKVKSWRIDGVLTHRNVLTQYYRGEDELTINSEQDLVCADGIGIQSYQTAGVFGVDGVSEAINLRMGSIPFAQTIYTNEAPAGPTVISSPDGYWPRFSFTADSYSYITDYAPNLPSFPVAGYSLSGPPSDPPQPGVGVSVDYFLESGPLVWNGISIRLCRWAIKSGPVEDPTNAAAAPWSGSISPDEYWPYAD